MKTGNEVVEDAIAQREYREENREKRNICKTAQRRLTQSAVLSRRDLLSLRIKVIQQDMEQITILRGIQVDRPHDDGKGLRLDAMQSVLVGGKRRQAVENRASSVAAGVVYDKREGKPVAETRTVLQCETKSSA